MHTTDYYGLCGSEEKELIVELRFIATQKCFHPTHDWPSKKGNAKYLDLTDVNIHAST